MPGHVHVRGIAACASSHTARSTHAPPPQHARARALVGRLAGGQRRQARRLADRQAERQALVCLVFGLLGIPRSSTMSAAHRTTKVNQQAARARAWTLPGNRATEQRGNMCVCVFVRARVGACRVVGGQWSVVSGQWSVVSDGCVRSCTTSFAFVRSFVRLRCSTALLLQLLPLQQLVAIVDC